NTIRIRGAEDAEEAGSALAARDVNGDGRDDLIIGARLASRHNRIEAGAVYVLHGAADLHLKGTVDLADTSLAISRIEGARAGDRAGSAVGAADLNDDGFADIAAGAPYADPGGRSNAGDTRVIFGFGAPAIIGFHPGENEAVSPDREITVSFNSDMVQAVMEVYDAFAGLTDTLATSGSSVTYRFPELFRAGSQIRVTVNATDRDSQAIPQKIWYFDIKPDELPPRMRSRSPESGETFVSPGQNITVVFSPDIRPDSTVVTIRGRDNRVITMTKLWADSTLTLENSNSFQLSETITVAISAADVYGDRADSTWTFTTRPETTSPLCTAQVPGNPQLLNRNAWFRLAFPFDVDKPTVTALLSGSHSGDISGTWVWADTSYTFTPAYPLQPGETLLLTVSAADIHKNTITGWTAPFAVKPDEIPPAITVHSPGRNEANVSPSAPLTLTFSEDVNRDSTTVTVTGKVQGTVSTNRSWIDYTLTLSHGTAFLLSDTLTVQVNTGDSYANRSAWSWSFAVRPETIAPAFSISSPVNWNSIAATDSITLIFPADVDASTVAVTLKGRLNENIPGSWRWSGTKFTFTPSQPYQTGNILTLTVNAKDIHNNAIQETIVSFTVKPESIPPVILSHTPAAYAAGVPLSPAMTVRFNGDVFPDSTLITITSDKRSSIGLSRVWTDSTLTISPGSQFQQNETVTVAVNAADRYINRTVYAWTFTTGSEIPPPYSVALPGDPNLLLTNTPLPLRVRRTVDFATLVFSLAGSLSGTVAGSRTWSDSTLTFTPSSGYRSGETLTLTVQGTDIYGNVIPAFARSFRVRPDQAPPAILSRIPVPDAQNEHPSQNLVLRFTGDVERDSTTVQVRGAQNRVITLTSSWQDSTLTLANSNAFRLGETVTVTVRAGDRYANRSEYSWSFTVRPETSPPAFLVLAPLHTQLMLPRDSITLAFPGDVDKGTVRISLTGSLSGTVQGAWAWADSLYTYTPQGCRPGETLTLTVNAADIHRNAIPETVHTFRVKLDNLPPAVRSHTPFSGERNVDPMRDIVIALTGDALPDSTTVQVRGAQNRPISMTSSWRDSTITLRNNSSFRLGEVIVATVRMGDAWANRAEYSWSFTIRPESNPPVFQAEVPGDPAALAADAPLTLIFPGDVDIPSVSVILTGSVSGEAIGDWVWEGFRYTFTPGALYRPGETLTLLAAAADTSGNRVPDTELTFTVGEHTPRLAIHAAEFTDSTKTVLRVRYDFSDPDGNFTLTSGWQYSIDCGPWTSIPEKDIAGNASLPPGTHEILWTLPALSVVY
ncbi:MAG: Ig-like domain-containing protein, partial [Candidatus Latescibacterota bacterium]